MAFAKANIDSQRNVFAEEPHSTFLCSQCKEVFKDPVLAVGCGHSFCRQCTEGLEACPVDGKDFQMVVPNLSLQNHVGELKVFCTNGIHLNSQTNLYEQDDDGCPEILTIANKAVHEENCVYAKVTCERNPSCPLIRKKDLAEHLRICQKVSCPHEKYGCSFTGFDQELPEHLSVCPFDALKEYLQQNDEQFRKLQITLERTIGDLEFVKGALSSRVESFELLELSNKKLFDEVEQLKRDNNALSEHLEQLSDVVNILSFQYQSLAQGQIYRCMGTCVGHQGPVWCLVFQGDYLYTGSSDKSIKVWHTGQEYKCIKTLEGHTDTVLCLTIVGQRLFSGGKDNCIREWRTDREWHSDAKIFPAHDGFYVCSLASNRQYLFSGSNSNVKIWELNTLQLVTECNAFKTWVRCLTAQHKFLYAGADVVKVISLSDFEAKKTLVFPDPEVHAYALVEVENMLVCGTGIGTMHVWDCETYTPLANMTGHTDRINFLCAFQGPNGMWKVFSASNDRSVRVWRMDYKICTQSLVRHQGGVLALAMGKGRLFSGSVDTTVKVWTSGP